MERQSRKEREAYKIRTKRRGAKDQPKEKRQNTPPMEGKREEGRKEAYNSDRSGDLRTEKKRSGHRIPVER